MCINNKLEAAILTEYNPANFNSISCLDIKIKTLQFYLLRCQIIVCTYQSQLATLQIKLRYKISDKKV